MWVQITINNKAVPLIAHVNKSTNALMGLEIETGRVYTLLKLK